MRWQVPADGETPNFNLYTPLPFKDVITVSATQVRPGNYAATHHITTGLVNLPPGMVLGTGTAWAGGPVVDYVPVPDPNADAGTSARLTADGRTLEERDQDTQRADRAGFGPYIPGVGADVVREGQARQIRGDLYDYIIWNLHYPGHRKAGDRPAVGRCLAGGRKGYESRAEPLSLNEHTSQGRQLVAPAPMSPEERLAARRSLQWARD